MSDAAAEEVVFRVTVVETRRVTYEVSTRVHGALVEETAKRLALEEDCAAFRVHDEDQKVEAVERLTGVEPTDTVQCPLCRETDVHVDEDGRIDVHDALEDLAGIRMDAEDRCECDASGQTMREVFRDYKVATDLPPPEKPNRSTRAASRDEDEEE